MARRRAAGAEGAQRSRTLLAALDRTAPVPTPARVVERVGSAADEAGPTPPPLSIPEPPTPAEVHARSLNMVLWEPDPSAAEVAGAGAGAGAPRWKLPAYTRSLTLPPGRVRRTLGGVYLEVSDRAGRVVHVVRAHPAGSLPSRRRGRGWSSRIPIPSSAYCRTCRSFDCEGARYTLTVMPVYLGEAPGFEEVPGHVG